MKKSNGEKQRRPDATDAIVGERIRMGRLIAKLSQTELAGKIGVTFQQVQKYEKGVNRVGAGRLQRVAEALGVTITWLYGDEKSSPKNRSDDPLTKLGQTRDGVRLANAFLAIKDTAKRHAIVANAEAMAA